MRDYPFDILNKPIHELDFSPAFKAFAQEKGYGNLSEMILIGTQALDRTAGFSKRMLAEYLQFLENENLDEYIDS